MSSFQFHKGTIKTVIVKDVVVLCLGFNSIKVRLRRNNLTDYMYSQPCFNSIKVRLRHETALCDCVQGVFQFHKGTIKTVDCRLLVAAVYVSIP